MAEWENAPLDPKKKKKQRVNLEPPRPMAARLKKKQRVNLEPRRPMAARLISFISSECARNSISSLNTTTCNMRNICQNISSLSLIVSLLKS